MICSQISAQNELDSNAFKTLNVIQKYDVFYESSDSIKRVYSDYFRQQFNGKDSIYDRLVLSKLNFLDGQYVKSLSILDELLNDKHIILSIDDSVKVLSGLKESYYQLHMYSEIFEINSTIKRLISSGAKYDLWTYNMNSKLFNKLKLYDKAAFALEEEIQELNVSNIKDSLIIPSAYNDLGFYYYRVKKYDKALENYGKAISFSEAYLKKDNLDHYYRITSVVNGNIGEIYLRRGQHEKAIPLLLNDINVGLVKKENLCSALNSYNLLVKSYLTLGHLDKANKALEEIKRLLVQTNCKIAEVNYTKHKASLCYELGESDSSYYYFNKTFKLSEAIRSGGVNKILASNELIYMRTEKRKLLEQHNIELKNQEISLKNKQKNTVLALALVLTILLIFSLYNSYYLRKSRRDVKIKNAQILSKNAQISKALSEKDVLLKEVHHRVKNNLQMISSLLELQDIRIKDTRVKTLLKEGQNRIQSVALIHKMMYQSKNLSKVNMQQYLDELVNELAKSYTNSPGHVTIEVHAFDLDFDVSTAIPISLIVNEAICNAFKYAFVNVKQGMIDVELKRHHDDQFSLRILDNGIGFNQSEASQIGGLGFDLMQGLTRQLNGNLYFNKHAETGFEVLVIFKNNRHE